MNYLIKVIYLIWTKRPFILKWLQRLIGTKSVNVKIHGDEHLRITVMLAIGANGIRLPTLVVFKGKKDAIKD